MPAGTTSLIVHHNDGGYEWPDWDEQVSDVSPGNDFFAPEGAGLYVRNTTAGAIDLLFEADVGGVETVVKTVSIPGSGTENGVKVFYGFPVILREHRVTNSAKNGYVFCRQATGSDGDLRMTPFVVPRAVMSRVFPRIGIPSARPYSRRAIHQSSLQFDFDPGAVPQIAGPTRFWRDQANGLDWSAGHANSADENIRWPTLFTSGGPRGLPYADFERDSSQYLINLKGNVGAGDLLVAGVVYFESASNVQRLFNQNGAASIFVGRNSSNQFQISNQSSMNDTTHALSTAVWYRFVARSGNGTAVFYVDGTVHSGTTGASPGTPNIGRIGADNTGANAADGRIARLVGWRANAANSDLPDPLVVDAWLASLYANP